jgi:TPR repeat protein
LEFKDKGPATLIDPDDGDINTLLASAPMTRAKSCLITILLLAALGLPFYFARQFVVGRFKEFNESSKLRENFHRVKDRAESGDAFAQAELGECYVKGLGVDQSLVEGEMWLRRSAESGNTAGQNGLGHYYFDGTGGSRNLDEAARWYGKAADQGVAPALLYLGLCHKAAGEASGNFVDAYAYYLSYRSYEGRLWSLIGGRQELADLAKRMTASDLALAEQRSKEIKASFEPKYLARRRQDAEKIQAEYDKLIEEKSSGK